MPLLSAASEVLPAERLLFVERAAYSSVAYRPTTTTAVERRQEAYPAIASYRVVVVCASYVGAERLQLIQALAVARALASRSAQLRLYADRAA